MSPETFHELSGRRPLISDPASAEPEPAGTVGPFGASPSRSCDAPASQAREY